MKTEQANLLPLKQFFQCVFINLKIFIYLMKSCRSGCSGNFHVPHQTHLHTQGLMFGKAALNYGVRIRKNVAGVDVLTGMALEKFPLPSKFPVVFVVHMIGGVRLVVVSKV